ncbi:3-deoxy-D-arabino-heptulosonate 7-phosphate synthase [Bordetella sp. LUAb4]|uniref:3-deoxy-D-arabino-heptulosonate 7-phosphate synthase n=1 Tax=Bordetella sp. LUAb4 TaxID=2843195 RepID=UPI001E4980E8|nr:3-deoxy-D-arabino-heptulosonate 7-phosphate synthase [Bordetella sp. LUAb4]
MPRAHPCRPIDDVLSAVARRYRIPAIPSIPCVVAAAPMINPATELALIIEQARIATTQGHTPDPTLQDAFTDRLARLIQDAMRPMHGDFAFQAMVLRHRVPRVREYASLSAHAEQDRRAVLSSVNAIAHPGKQQRLPPGTLRDTLAQLQASAASASWSALADIARLSLSVPAFTEDSAIERGLQKLLDDPALARLQRLAVLDADDAVRQYETLWDRRGPRSGSVQAAALGKTTQQRGAAVEALAAQALQAWACKLGEAQGDPTSFRVVTSMRVPASLAANADRAKTEWDAVLLRRARKDDCWDICLVAEVKSSVDAATTDYPRLLRGLRLLTQANGTARYPFACQEGVIEVRGASLQALPTDSDCAAAAVLYCCDASTEETPRLLNAASRMQLLSAAESLAYAAHLEENAAADPALLQAVWNKLLSSPQWQPVLRQYATLHQVRELMVHVADLADAIAKDRPPGACPTLADNTR